MISVQMVSDLCSLESRNRTKCMRQSVLLMKTVSYPDMCARHDLIIESACLWLEDLISIQFNSIQFNSIQFDAGNFISEGETLDKVQEHRGRISIGRSDLPYAALWGPDPPPDRAHILVLAPLPRSEFRVYGLGF